jgi:hypothetical protein
MNATRASGIKGRSIWVTVLRASSDREIGEEDIDWAPVLWQALHQSVSFWESSPRQPNQLARPFHAAVDGRCKAAYARPRRDEAEARIKKAARSGSMESLAPALRRTLVRFPESEAIWTTPCS